MQQHVFNIVSARRQEKPTACFYFRQAKSNDFWRYPSSPDVSFNFVLSESGFFGNNNSNKTEKKSTLPFLIAWPPATRDVIVA